MLAIGRALMVNPALLLLDEPMEGLAPIIVQELMVVIRELVEDGGMAVIVVEQHAKLALSLTRQAIVLERGRVVHRAASETLLREPERPASPGGRRMNSPHAHCVRCPPGGRTVPFGRPCGRMNSPRAHYVRCPPRGRTVPFGRPCGHRGEPW